MEQPRAYAEPKIGLFGIGLDAYWPQFPGLEERLKGYTREVAQKLERAGARVVNLGLIDTPEKALTGAGHEFRRADVDLIFLTSQLRTLFDRASSGPAGQGPRHHSESEFPPRPLTMTGSMAWATGPR
jgi:hypothetical protein